MDHLSSYSFKVPELSWYSREIVLQRMAYIANAENRYLKDRLTVLEVRVDDLEKLLLKRRTGCLDSVRAVVARFVLRHA